MMGDHETQKPIAETLDDLPLPPRPGDKSYNVGQEQQPGDFRILIEVECDPDQAEFVRERAMSAAAYASSRGIKPKVVTRATTHVTFHGTKEDVDKFEKELEASLADEDRVSVFTAGRKDGKKA